MTRTVVIIDLIGSNLERKRMEDRHLDVLGDLATASSSTRLLAQ